MHRWEFMWAELCNVLHHRSAQATNSNLDHASGAPVSQQGAQGRCVPAADRYVLCYNLAIKS